MVFITDMAHVRGGGKLDRETESLKKNLTDQLDRLMAQLVDLELERSR